jgi:hypothetical protein
MRVFLGQERATSSSTLIQCVITLWFRTLIHAAIAITLWAVKDFTNFGSPFALI